MGPEDRHRERRRTPQRLRTRQMLDDMCHSSTRTLFPQPTRSGVVPACLEKHTMLLCPTHPARIARPRRDARPQSLEGCRFQAFACDTSQRWSNRQLPSRQQGADLDETISRRSGRVFDPSMAMSWRASPGHRNVRCVVARRGFTTFDQRWLEYEREVRRGLALEPL